MSQSPTAAVLLIGNEVLSGRTKDKNLGFIADYLAALGIDLLEARVVADDEDDIGVAVNALMMTSPPIASPKRLAFRFHIIRMRWQF
jgi:molybdopterin-biosynthesis enzyme MoeA-like protein